MAGYDLNRRVFIRGVLGASAMLPALAKGLREGKLEESVRLIQRFVTEGKLRSASLQVRQNDRIFGKAFGEETTLESIFLLASITKPMTAAGVMILVDRGELALSDLVHKYIPKFTAGDRKSITIRHLLTHTSGLPDQLPDNIELRKRHAPLREFVERVLETPLLFKPGTRVKYQSMGFLLAAEVIERITHKRFRDFVQDELFQPLGMQNTVLGLDSLKISDTAQSQVEEGPESYKWRGSDTLSWNWNSRYWRDLGTPWGGAHSTGIDLEKFLWYFLHPDGSVLKEDTAAAMITNQNQGLEIPWGLGFMVQTKRFGSVCSPQTFGHWGSSGTIAWADPQRDLTCVLLTTLPATVSRKILLEPISDLVAESAL